MTNQITIEYVERAARWEARFAYNPALIQTAKGLKFRWDPSARVWWTKDELAAQAFKGGDALDVWNVAEAARIEKVNAERAAQAAAAAGSLEASRATDAMIDIPSNAGLNYLGYQRGGIAYAMERDATLIGDEMGLGKTIQAIGVSNADASVRKVLVICPAFLKINWQREWRKWCVKHLNVSVVGKKGWVAECDFADVVIINYDILHKYRAEIDARQWDLLVVDEAHYLKNPKAKRTKAVLGSKERGQEATAGLVARRRVFMTGTPILNRPIELWPLVQALDPQDLGRNFFAFAKRYCAAYNNGHGWDFTGSSNLDELQQKLRAKFMVRRLKADVLAELPPKRRQIVPLTSPEIAKIVGKEGTSAARYEALMAELAVAEALALVDSKYEARVAELQDETGFAFEEMAQARHDIALAKVGAAIEYIREAIEELGCVAIMCHHQDVAEQIAEAFADLGSVVVHGSKSVEARQAAVDAFMTGQANVFIGTIKTAVGYTITRTASMFFVELDWVPGNVSQAEDRIHRIGQVGSVLIQHLVADGSIDARIANVLVDKQDVIDRALDIEGDAIVAEPKLESFAPVSQATVAKGWEAVQEREFTKRVYSDSDRVSAAYALRASNLERVAKVLTQSQIDAVHTAVRMLNDANYDSATERNGVGYNQADTGIGRALARMETLTPEAAALGAHIVRKYKGQYGRDLYDQIFTDGGKA
jgi:SWI/SNF-related matrix-associated actin-dependent regulator 1 of chromatin subfamily A